MFLQMRQELEIRLSAAEDLKKVAKKEKLEKEATAQRALAEQQALLEKVHHESKLLQEEEERNNKVATLQKKLYHYSCMHLCNGNSLTKCNFIICLEQLRMFLIDHGHIVDVLQ